MVLALSLDAGGSGEENCKRDIPDEGTHCLWIRHTTGMRSPGIPLACAFFVIMGA